MCTAHCRLHNEYFTLYNAHCICIMPYRDCKFWMHTAWGKLLAASWYSHPSLNSDFFETRSYCNWQFKGQLQSIINTPLKKRTGYTAQRVSKHITCYCPLLRRIPFLCCVVFVLCSLCCSLYCCSVPLPLCPSSLLLCFPYSCCCPVLFPDFQFVPLSWLFVACCCCSCVRSCSVCQCLLFHLLSPCSCVSLMLPLRLFIPLHIVIQSARMVSSSFLPWSCLYPFPLFLSVFGMWRVSIPLTARIVASQHLRHDGKYIWVKRSIHHSRFYFCSA